jgi:hypothetical protein
MRAKSDTKSVMGLKTAATALAVGSLVFSYTVAAEDRSGDWIYGNTDKGDTYYAYTINDSGAVFGEWCSITTGSCSWLIGLSAACEQNSSYPILANTDGGSASVTISCGGKVADLNLSRYQFTNYKNIEGILNSATKVGFAFPMQAGEFRVVRFSLSGEQDAISNMERQVSRVYKGPAKPSTRDTVL